MEYLEYLKFEWFHNLSFYVKINIYFPCKPALSLERERENRIKKVRWIDLEIQILYFHNSTFILSQHK